MRGRQVRRGVDPAEALAVAGSTPRLRGGGSGLVAWPVFKTATESPRGAPVGSIPTRSRHLRRAGALVVALLAPAAAGAQQPVPPPVLPPTVVTPAPVDTITAVSRPVKPLKAFFMSLAVPGWGQARLDRKLTGAIFISIEGLSLGMTMKTIRELKYLTRVDADSARLAGKRSQRQDWLILLGFNHLFSGLEAFVATQLHDFPTDVRFRIMPVPGGGVAATASIPVRFR